MNRTKHAHCGTKVFSTWQLRRAFTHFNAELSACPSKYIIKVFKKMSLSFRLFTLYKQFLWDKNVFLESFVHFSVRN